LKSINDIRKFAELPDQQVDCVAKVKRIHVFTDHVQQEEITNLAVTHQFGGQAAAIDSLQSIPDDQSPQWRHQEDQKSKQEIQDAHQSQDGQPEPEESVDLLIDDVQL
jgi:hypothetical protein